MKDTKPSALSKLITEAFAMEVESAQEAGALGFMARAMVQASLPHSKTEGRDFERTNGNFTLRVTADPDAGLPYGSIPRLLLAWVTTEAVRTRSRDLELGDTLTGFMRELDLVPTGGRWGSITRLREQTRRLFYAQFVAIYRAGKNEKRRTRQIADDTDFWWDHRSPGQGSLWKSTVRLSEPFFTEIVDSPIPIDMRALRALKRSPMALDIYCWLTYRMSYLKAPAAIPWEALQRQFGAGYAETALGTRHFRESFLKALKKVGVVYPEARIEANTPGVKLIPSRAHVRGR